MGRDKLAARPPRSSLTKQSSVSSLLYGNGPAVDVKSDAFRRATRLLGTGQSLMSEASPVTLLTLFRQRKFDEFKNTIEWLHEQAKKDAGIRELVHKNLFSQKSAWYEAYEQTLETWRKEELVNLRTNNIALAREAIASGNAAKLESILQRLDLTLLRRALANIDEETGYNLLHQAALSPKNNREMVRVLLAAARRTNIHDYVNSKTNTEETALSLVVKRFYDKPDSNKQLLKVLQPLFDAKGVVPETFSLKPAPSAEPKGTEQPERAEEVRYKVYGFKIEKALKALIQAKNQKNKVVWDRTKTALLSELRALSEQALEKSKTLMFYKSLEGLSGQSLMSAVLNLPSEDLIAEIAANVSAEITPGGGTSPDSAVNYDRRKLKSLFRANLIVLQEVVAKKYMYASTSLTGDLIKATDTYMRKSNICTVALKMHYRANDGGLWSRIWRKGKTMAEKSADEMTVAVEKASLVAGDVVKSFNNRRP